MNAGTLFVLATLAVIATLAPRLARTALLVAGAVLILVLAPPLRHALAALLQVIGILHVASGGRP